MIEFEFVVALMVGPIAVLVSGLISRRDMKRERDVICDRSTT